MIKLLSCNMPKTLQKQTNRKQAHLKIGEIQNRVCSLVNYIVSMSVSWL